MIARPKTMQTAIDQRWHDLRVEVDRERLAMTAREQSPVAAPPAWLRLLLANAVRKLHPILGGDLEFGMPRGFRRSLIS
jgi:hypothetical protein